MAPAVIYIVCKAGLGVWGKRLPSKKYWQVLVAGVVLVCNGAGMVLMGVQFLYHSQEANVAFARENAQYQAVVVYGSVQQEQSWYVSNEFWPYDCIVYVDYSDWDYVLRSETLQTAEKLIMYIDCPEDILDHMIAQYDNLRSYSLVLQNALYRVYKVE